MLKRTAWVSPILILVLSFGATPSAKSDDDMGPICESVLDQLASHSHGLLLVLDPTVQVQHFDLAMIKGLNFAEKLPGVSTGEMQSLMVLKDSHVSLGKFIRVNERWVLLSKERQRSLGFGTPRSVKKIRKAYPRADSLVKISRAFLHASGNEALIYLEAYGICDHPCGGTGSLLSLRRTDDRWSVQSQYLLCRAHW